MNINHNQIIKSAQDLKELGLNKRADLVIELAKEAQWLDRLKQTVTDKAKGVGKGVKNLVETFDKSNWTPESVKQVFKDTPDAPWYRPDKRFEYGKGVGEEKGKLSYVEKSFAEWTHTWKELKKVQENIAPQKAQLQQELRKVWENALDTGPYQEILKGDDYKAGLGSNFDELKDGLTKVKQLKKELIKSLRRALELHDRRGQILQDMAPHMESTGMTSMLQGMQEAYDKELNYVFKGLQVPDFGPTTQDSDVDTDRIESQLDSIDQDQWLETYRMLVDIRDSNSQDLTTEAMRRLQYMTQQLVGMNNLREKLIQKRYDDKLTSKELIHMRKLDYIIEQVQSMGGPPIITPSPISDPTADPAIDPTADPIPIDPTTDPTVDLDPTMTEEPRSDDYTQEEIADIFQGRDPESTDSTDPSDVADFIQIATNEDLDDIEWDRQISEYLEASADDTTRIRLLSEAIKPDYANDMAEDRRNYLTSVHDYIVERNAQPGGVPEESTVPEAEQPMPERAEDRLEELQEKAELEELSLDETEELRLLLNQSHTPGVETRDDEEPGEETPVPAGPVIEEPAPDVGPGVMEREMNEAAENAGVVEDGAGDDESTEDMPLAFPTSTPTNPYQFMFEKLIRDKAVPNADGTTGKKIGGEEIDYDLVEKWLPVSSTDAKGNIVFEETWNQALKRTNLLDYLGMYNDVSKRSNLSVDNIVSLQHLFKFLYSDIIEKHYNSRDERDRKLSEFNEKVRLGESILQIPADSRSEDQKSFLIKHFPVRGRPKDKDEARRKAIFKRKVTVPALYQASGPVFPDFINQAQFIERAKHMYVRRENQTQLNLLRGKAPSEDIYGDEDEDARDSYEAQALRANIATSDAALSTDVGSGSAMFRKIHDKMGLPYPTKVITKVYIQKIDSQFKKQFITNQTPTEEELSMHLYLIDHRAVTQKQEDKASAKLKGQHTDFELDHIKVRKLWNGWLTDRISKQVAAVNDVLNTNGLNDLALKRDQFIGVSGEQLTSEYIDSNILANISDKDLREDIAKQITVARDDADAKHINEKGDRNKYLLYNKDSYINPRNYISYGAADTTMEQDYEEFAAVAKDFFQKYGLPFEYSEVSEHRTNPVMDPKFPSFDQKYKQPGMYNPELEFPRVRDILHGDVPDLTKEQWSMLKNYNRGLSPNDQARMTPQILLNKLSLPNGLETVRKEIDDIVTGHEQQGVTPDYYDRSDPIVGRDGVVRNKSERHQQYKRFEEDNPMVELTPREQAIEGVRYQPLAETIGPEDRVVLDQMSDEQKAHMAIPQELWANDGKFAGHKMFIINLSKIT